MTSRIQTKQVLLERLIENSGVFLFASELGPAFPITHDFQVCAGFFKPWLNVFRIGYCGGRYSIETPLANIAARGHGQAVLDAISRAPRPFLNTLLWPHSALAFLAADDMESAREHLRNAGIWTPEEPSAWESAGIYWSVFLDDKQMAGLCFRKAAAACKEYLPNGNLNSLAHAYCLCCGDPESARRLLLSAHYDNRYKIELYVLLELIERANAWKTLFNDEHYSTRCLEAAAATAAKNGELYCLAMAWNGLFGDKEKASALAKQGMESRYECLLPAAMYWRCFENAPEKARQCLWSRELSQYRSALFRMSLAKSIVMFNGLDSRPECLRAAECLIMEVADENETLVRHVCAAAELMSRLLGRGAKKLLEAAESRAEETCDLLSIAEAWKRLAHLPYDERHSLCAETLTRAESMAADEVDYILCAHAWKKEAGDELSAERCLRKAEQEKTESHDEMLVSAWTKLLGRPNEARRLAGKNPV